MAEHGDGLRLVAKHRELPVQLPRQPVIVRVQESDERPPRQPQAGIPGGADAGILLVMVMHVAMPRAHHVSRAVGGAVIDDNDLRPAAGLPADAGERLVQIGLSVEDRDDHADQREIVAHDWVRFLFRCVFSACSSCFDAYRI